MQSASERTARSLDPAFLAPGLALAAVSWGSLRLATSVVERERSQEIAAAVTGLSHTRQGTNDTTFWTIPLPIHL